MTIQIKDLKFPVGEFSHTELGAFNGVDRKKVWTAYQTAIAEGIIKSSGNQRKSGKGKAAALWVVADPTKVNMSTESVPVVVPATAPEVEAVAAKPKKQKKEKVEPVVVPTVEPSPVVISVPEVATPVQVVPPAVAPVETVVSVLEEVVPSVVPTQSESTVVNPATIVGDITPIEDKCPYCANPLVTARTAAGGVRVWCPINDPKICSCSENPYGYSNNVVNAVKILNDKFCRVPNEA